MNKVKCVKCGKEFPLVETFEIMSKNYAECPSCGILLKTDKEVELNDEQIEAADKVYNAVYDMCKTITGDDDLEWDMSYIGHIADRAIDLLGVNGYPIRYPAVVIDRGHAYIEEFSAYKLKKDGIRYERK